MYKRASAAAIATALVLMASAAFASTDVRVELEGRYWLPSLDAEGRAVESGVGSVIDFKSDLGVQDEDFPEGRLTLHASKKHRIRIAYLQMGYDGDNILSRTIEFNGEIIPVDTRVISSLDLSYLRVGWIWQFIDVDDGKFRLGTVLEGVGVWADAVLAAPELAVSEREDFSIGLPAVGLALDINPHKAVNIFAYVTGMHAGDYGYYVDAEAGLRVVPVRNLSIIGGYRVLRVSAEDDPDFLDVQIAGPFAGATLRF